jgi:hypothetical protein
MDGAFPFLRAWDSTVSVTETIQEKGNQSYVVQYDECLILRVNTSKSHCCSKRLLSLGGCVMLEVALMYFCSHINFYSLRLFAFWQWKKMLAF